MFSNIKEIIRDLRNQFKYSKKLSENNRRDIIDLQARVAALESQHKDDL